MSGIKSSGIKTGGRVFLVGAGPGAPDLIAVRGADALRRAEVVVYDYLVSPELLHLAPASAELIYAGKKGGGNKSIEQSELNRALIKHARRGRLVVRLKGGDPFIFGRGGEEAEALARAKIPFEVVPGVTSAIAAPAFAGIPLTHREHGSFVAFVTGHEDERKGAHSAIPWKDLATAAKARGTIVILMATARMRTILKRLADAGLPIDTPAAAVMWATTASQKTVSATLATLAERCARENITSPTVIVVGECVRLREHLAWFERMPLFGRTIVVTRARATASAFTTELRRLGADVIEFPTIETAPPTSYVTLDNAIARLEFFDWLVFTSPTGVDAFFDRLKSLGHDLREMGLCSIAAIGPATADRIANYALKVAALPTEYRAEAIIPAIGIPRIRGKRFLIPRAEVAREILPEELLTHGAAEVVVAPAYRTVKPKRVRVDRMRDLIAAGTIDLVTFTSSSTVENFCAMVSSANRRKAPAGGIKAAVIGPITAETARRKGFDVVVSPAEFTIPALTDAIRAYFASAKP
jgi:uroporphyrinogen III methyltransferase/synthase